MMVSLPNAIPRRLYQTWKNEQVPSCWRSYQRSWRVQHPHWEHQLFTDHDLRELVHTHYGWFIPIYDAYPQHIMRVDAARYFLLHLHGGLYVDMDFESLRPIDPLLENHGLVFGCEPPGHTALAAARQRGLRRIVCNALMASTVGHPFWEHVFELLVARRSEPDPLDATGPFLLTGAAETYMGAERLTVVPWELLYPVGIPESEVQDYCSGAEWRAQAFGIHHWAGSWWRGPGTLGGWGAA
jgi:mannosyltransferase OCH1-like enzyme